MTADHEQPRHRIGPPPAEPCIEPKTGQEDRGQVRADSRLTRLCLESAAPQRTGDPALEVDEERHSCQHPLLVDRGLP